LPAYARRHELCRPLRGSEVFSCCSENRTKTMDRRGRYRYPGRNRSQRSWLSRSSDALPQAPMAIAIATPIPIPTAEAAPPLSCTWLRTVRMSYCSENRTKTMDRRGRYPGRNRSQRSWLSRSSGTLPQAPMAIATANPIPTPTPTAEAAPPFSCTRVRTVRMSCCLENRRSAGTQAGPLLPPTLSLGALRVFYLPDVTL